MVKKRIDNRIRLLIENGVTTKQRSMFVVIGDKARDQTVILHHMLSKAQIKARPSVLWCYKKELGFSSHRKKRMKQLQKKINYGKLDVNEDDPFELFVASTNIRYCYYNETHKILGNTFGMLILQDFEAITPNLLARTIETIEGGGIVVILLRTMSSLKQFYTMSMDVHSRFRTESHQDVVARFNERFLLSLSTNKHCLVVDDQLNILPISSKTLVIEQIVNNKEKGEMSKEDQELASIKESLADTQPASSIISCCKTLDQAKCVLKFIDAISEKQLRSTISLTAARGRGKSAALGLSIASAVAFGYSNIFVTSPTPENLKTLFDFVLKGFDALDYQEHVDYEVVQSTNPEFNNAVIRVNIFKEHRQTIQYINPKDSAQLGQAELVVIDEAAAIPLPLVKNLLGPYLVFMSSTINGYEGTGRSLSLKLLQQLRQQTASLSGASTNVEVKKQIQLSASGKVLHELQLNESIRYANGDLIEKWLNDLLCLNCCQQVITPELRLKRSCPIPESCDLYYINRDTLFSYHKVSELFLQHLMSLYVASHYKNTPNDLQMLSDAPAHHLFCLLGPFNMKNEQNADKVYQLPEILCVVQVCLEGEISKDSVVDNLKRGKRANGDLIPWTVSQQFQDNDFPNLLGARVVRIATNPDYQSMGYGSRALKLLQDYYEGKIVDINENSESLKVNDDDNGEDNGKNIDEISDVDLLTETIEPKKKLPPLLLKLNERRAERLDYLGVSFGLTNDLLRFWKKSSFLPVYLRQTTNDLTGEHSCIMIKELNKDEEKKSVDSWLFQYFIDFRKRFIALLGYEFRIFLPAMTINMLKQSVYEEKIESITKQEIELYFTQYDYKRLEMYALNLVDYHLIMDLVPNMGKLFYTNKLGSEFTLSAVQSAILLGLGLQYKSIEVLEKDLNLPSNQLLALFNKIVKKFISLFEEINVTEISRSLNKNSDNLQAQAEKAKEMVPLRQTLAEELNEEAEKILKKEKEEKKANILQLNDLKQYAIKGDNNDWSDALKIGTDSSYVTVKRLSAVSEKRKIEFESHFDGNKKSKDHDDDGPEEDNKKKKHKKGDFAKKSGNNKNNNKKKDKFFTKKNK